MKALSLVILIALGLSTTACTQAGNYGSEWSTLKYSDSAVTVSDPLALGR